MSNKFNIIIGEGEVNTSSRIRAAASPGPSPHLNQGTEDRMIGEHVNIIYRTCAHCDKIMGVIKCDGQGGISHGHCDECHELVMLQIRATQEGNGALVEQINGILKFRKWAQQTREGGLKIRFAS